MEDLVRAVSLTRVVVPDRTAIYQAKAVIQVKVNIPGRATSREVQEEHLHSKMVETVVQMVKRQRRTLKPIRPAPRHLTTLFLLMRLAKLSGSC